MKKLYTLYAGLAAIAALAFVMLTGAVASATTETPGPSFTSCPNLAGWYANPDEQNDLPEPTEAGLKFEGKDLIHHATDPIDLADMDHVTTGFTATTAGKVLFKVETSTPYSTIITNPDGKLWSTAMTYDQEGGQGHPVAHYSDLVGKPTKPGKANFSSASRVATFGVGYAVEEGSTVVSSISFHGHVYPLTCVPPTSSPTPSASSSSASPSPSTSASHSVSPSASHSPAAGVPSTSPAAHGGAVSGGLPVTGAPAGLLAGGAAALLAIGAGLLLFVRRRKVSFTA